MKFRVLVSVAILLMWLAAFFLPVADAVNPTGGDMATGLVVLALGWMGPLIGQFGWYANLLLPIGLLVAALPRGGSWKFLMVAALALAAMAINSLFWSSIPMDNGENVIVRYRSGYWLWMASVAAGAAWLGFCALRRRSVPGARSRQN